MTSPLRTIVAAALIGSVLLGATASTGFAQQTTPNVDCAIAYSGEPPVGLVVTVGGPGTDAEAALCTDRIATGDWVGVSNLGEWKTGMRPLAVIWPRGHSDVLINVWTSYDWQSRYFGQAFVEGIRDPSGLMEIQYVNQP